MRGTKQVFIPSVGVEYESTHHADILCTLGPMMNETEWKEKGLDNYGLIAVNSEGNAAQVRYGKPFFRRPTSKRLCFTKEGLIGVS